MIKVKNLEFKNGLFLAPLAGVSDAPFRKICKEFGADFSFTEMVSCKGLKYDNNKTENMLKIDDENHIGVQIFGCDEDIMSDVVKNNIFLSKFDVIDINMGCPVPKVVKNGEGAALLKNPQKVAKIVEKVTKATSRPVSVKIRSGFDNDHINAVEIARICEENGASFLTIHGRTREQMYSGNVDYEIIKKVKDNLHIPVIGNGDVFNEENYLKMKATNCDGVMVARGSLGRPYIFSELIDKNFKVSKKNVVKKHIDLCKNFYEDELYAVKNLRKHLLWYLKGEKGAKIYKEKVTTCETFEELLKIVDEAFND